MKINKIIENLKREALDISEDLFDVLVNDRQWMNELIIKAQNQSLEKAYEELYTTYVEMQE